MRKFIERIIDWLNGHTLTMCSVCHRFLFYKDVHMVIHRITGRTELCELCYKKLFLPFSSEDPDA